MEISTTCTKKKLLPIASGDFETIRKNITTPGKWLDDQDLDTLLEVLRHNSSFDILSVHCIVPQNFSRVHELQNENDVQIIGGNCINHWCCYYYDDTKLIILESWREPEYEDLSNDEKQFIQVRYPKLSTKKVHSKLVQMQPNGSTCGIYAAAFATSLVLGKDPRYETYSRDAKKMRKHFAEIISSQKVLLRSFPAF